eukprot:CAMPEP_0170345978 /NCGR_PEP_ID=MMETSP0116_2-20130129/74234_1 /TAXON_ID=400756 /ORGANISM="Durinskia baltica, Strain CSIRO CS-38" /LENGTH=37 /DNA_ID= /DNA_START= /DNA_END= /DNA_ORIENTATION=
MTIIGTEAEAWRAKPPGDVGAAWRGGGAAQRAPMGSV